MSHLTDKIAIVTGAGRGIGAAVAEAYAHEGATVVVSDIDGDAAAAVAARLPHGATSLACDVRVEQQVEALVAHATERHGGLDVLVANAGIAPRPASIVDTDHEAWRRVLDVNLDGAYLGIKHAAPAMIAGGGGSIVTMASVTGLAGVPLGASYAASKAAVVSLTKTAALELRDHGVRVNAICPGFIGTDMVAAIAEPYSTALGTDLGALLDHGQGRMGEIQDLVPLAVWLASDATPFTTGGSFVVDGGLTASML
ncbi:MAG: glucose 1-dehydrogenase [Solirubrobacteraceae bacterium]|nr:glucose 1-dehydrogenase [Solirubrobacteraceae bacterium]